MRNVFIFVYFNVSHTKKINNNWNTRHSLMASYSSGHVHLNIFPFQHFFCICWDIKIKNLRCRLSQLLTYNRLSTLILSSTAATSPFTIGSSGKVTVIRDAINKGEYWKCEERDRPVRENHLKQDIALCIHTYCKSHSLQMRLNGNINSGNNAFQLAHWLLFVFLKNQQSPTCQRIAKNENMHTDVFWKITGLCRGYFQRQFSSTNIY